ncbi:prophage tail fiber N-terminal domain-containing protein, partial [Escherichia coli]
MAVRISGVLKDGAGKPIQNCTIQLKARRNSTTVVVNTVASENPDEAGRYTMDVEYGQYSVSLLVEGFPPSHAGIITVYEDSKPGTLNDFLGAMTEDDVRPEALRRFELMVEEVARNASAVAQNTAAASSASSAASSASSASASKDEATRQASAAKGSATTASTKATEAAGSATAASQSKTAAESAATRAEAAADRAEEIAGAVAMEDASLTTKGVVKLSSAVDSTSESLAATPKAVKAANDNANSRVPSNRKVNGKALTADITLTPKDIGTLNSVTMSFSGGAGWFKLATVTMPQASSIVYIALIGGAGYNVGSPHQAGISELVLRAGNGNPKGITGALWKRTAVGLTNFAWINTSGDTYDIYVEIGNYATRVNIHWDCTANATVSIYTSPTYSASKPSSVTDGVVYTMYSTHQKPTPLDIGALPTTGGTVSGPLSVTGGLTGSLNGNASTATKLQTARSIGGVVFDGSANINLPGVNTTGNQNTTGNAATATKLQTARKISGVPFDGSTDITLTAAHVAAFARRATDAYADADGGVPWNAESGA